MTEDYNFAIGLRANLPEIYFSSPEFFLQIN